MVECFTLPPTVFITSWFIEPTQCFRATRTLFPGLSMLHNLFVRLKRPCFLLTTFSNFVRLQVSLEPPQQLTRRFQDEQLSYQQFNQLPSSMPFGTGHLILTFVTWVLLVFFNQTFKFSQHFLTPFSPSPSHAWCSTYM